MSLRDVRQRRAWQKSRGVLDSRIPMSSPCRTNRQVAPQTRDRRRNPEMYRRASPWGGRVRSQAQSKRSAAPVGRQVATRGPVRERRKGQRGQASEGEQALEQEQASEREQARSPPRAMYRNK